MVNAINQRLGELGTRGVDYELGGNATPNRSFHPETAAQSQPCKSYLLILALICFASQASVGSRVGATRRANPTGLRCGPRIYSAPTLSPACDLAPYSRP